MDEDSGAIWKESLWRLLCGQKVGKRFARHKAREGTYLTKARSFDRFNNPEG